MSERVVVVCGSRKWDDWFLLKETLDTHVLGKFDRLAHGGAIGADLLAADWALHNAHMETEVFHPDYKRYGKGAPFVRNDAMLDLQPKLVLAFQRNNSPGTGYMIRGAMKRKLNLMVIHPRVEEEVAA